MNLDYLRYFVKLAQVQNYTRASEQLAITQPSLSHAISKLEQELGVLLFEKQGRNTTLTRFGEEFLLCAQRTLATLDTGVTSLQKSAQGEGLVRLGLLRPLGIEYIPRLAAQFMAAHPQKEINFTFHTGITGDLLQGLEQQQYDLVFSSRPENEAHLVATPIASQELVLIVPEQHPLADREAVSLADTLPYPYVYFAPGSGIRHDVDMLFADVQGSPLIACETEEDQVVAGLVAQGFGIAIVPYMDILAKLQLKIIPINKPAYERKFYMVHNPELFMPPVVQEFRKFVLQHSSPGQHLK